jgi:23S rRNA pseudouridine1911/1915/1917 synthase
MGRIEERHRELIGDRSGGRLDAFVAARVSQISRSAARRLIEAGAISVNGDPAEPSYKVRPGDVIEIDYTAPREHLDRIEPEPIPLDIVYEDDHLLVVNKEKGMVVHPAPGAWTGTLVNALIAHCGNLAERGGRVRPGIVHRLDKDTSGLMVVAKTDAAHASLGRQVQSRTARRRYLALVWGDPKWDEKKVDAPIGRHPVDRKRMAVLDDAALRGRTLRRREAQTRLRVLERYGVMALVEAELATGRTHQIRVHCAHLGHPVVGDAVYGGAGCGAVSGGAKHTSDPVLDRLVAELDGQALHAAYLSFTHPHTGERVEHTCPVRDEMQRLIEHLRSR